MAQEITIQPVGLYTYPNTFSEVPPGALSTASNVVIDRKGIVQSRRGFAAYSDSLGATVTNATVITPYQGGLVVHKAVTNKLAYDDDLTGVYTEYAGTYEPPSTLAGARIRFAGANKNLYFSSSNGVEKLASITGVPTFSGAPRAFGGTGVVTGASGFLADMSNVAYQIIWGYKDANNNLILGAPSERIIVSNNAGGTRNVTLTFQIPPEITENWFYQIYRSAETATLADIPDAELQQVYEDNPTGAEITASEVTVTDSVPSDLRQATIYTAPSQQGAQNANYQPPFSTDIVAYKNHLLFANTRRKHSTAYTLISVDGTGFVAGDTITFSVDGGTPTFTLTGAAAEDGALGEFQVFTTGTPSQNIENTAKSLIRIMNVYASNTFLNGYYTSGFDQLPGQMMIERRDLADDFVYINSDRGAAFTPILPVSGTSIQTTADIAPNRVYVSKFQQPESVPLYRTIDVGSAEIPIDRILALRDGVIILKGDGLFRISGETFETFRLATLDNTVRILAPNSAVVLANQVFFFSDQGIVAASDSGTAIISYPIENTLLELSSSIFPGFVDATFAVAYESDRKYMLFTVSEVADTVATQCFVYNSLTDSWTSWDRTQTCGLVNPVDNKLYLSPFNVDGGARIYRERKNFNRTDYADDQFNVTVVTSIGDVFVELTDTTGIEPGMTIVQGVREIVIADVISATEIELEEATTFTVGAAVVYQPISTEIQTIQISGKNPMMLKHFQEVSVIFSEAIFRQIELGYVSDFRSAVTTTELQTVASGIGWGGFEWGSIPWGASITVDPPPQRFRTYVPREYQRANWIQLSLSGSQAFTTFSFNGFAVSLLPTSTRMR